MMLKVCLGDAEATHLLFQAAEDLARAEAPATVRAEAPATVTRAFMAATMTALRKPDGGVRGIATGTSFRRLVAKTLARQFGKVVESTCAPFQFALSTRAGTDCVGHTIRAMTDADPECTVLSIDGIGAYDHILRSQGLLPFVRSICARQDREGVKHRIVQAEGGEQGDPLMPLLFSLGIHDSLCAVKERLRPQDELFAYLDDVHVASLPNRTRGAYNLLEAELLLEQGSVCTLARHARGIAAEYDLQIWTTWGMTCGTPKASKSWVPQSVPKTSSREPWTGEWKTKRNCGTVSRGCPTCSAHGRFCHHLLRMLLPSQSLEYAARHDEGMLQAMDDLLGGLTGGEDEKEVAHLVASLPMRLGGLGLRSARRMAPGAYWSSWADALAMIHQRLPRVADNITDRLEGAVAVEGCLGELHEVGDRLDRQGFVGRPGWAELKLGAHTVEPGEWAHGWQYHASSASEYHFRETVVLPQSNPHFDPRKAEVAFGCD